MKSVKLLALFVALLFVRNACADSGVIYAACDSAEVEKWLRDAPRNASTNALALHFAKLMIGRPYVASTLERSDRECLIVNTRELDCTTLVETSAALALTAKAGKRRFADYCAALQNLRYRGGKIADYSSRLHYFTEWIIDNERAGFVFDAGRSGVAPFTARQIVDATYMSAHPQSYKHLSGNAAMLAKIRKMERSLCGKTVRYIPKSKLNRPKAELPVEDGDIIALVTNKKGLEISHVGIAAWQNGKLHLLNASSLKKKVILDTQTLYEYQRTRNSQLGIRVVRFKSLNKGSVR